MKKITKKVFEPIDQEEEDIIKSLENDDWQVVGNFEKEKEKAIIAARNTLKKDT